MKGDTWIWRHQDNKRRTTWHQSFKTRALYVKRKLHHQGYCGPMRAPCQINQTFVSLFLLRNRLLHLEGIQVKITSPWVPSECEKNRLQYTWTLSPRVRNSQETRQVLNRSRTTKNTLCMWTLHLERTSKKREDGWNLTAPRNVLKFRLILRLTKKCTVMLISVPTKNAIKFLCPTILENTAWNPFLPNRHVNMSTSTSAVSQKAKAR